MKQVPALFLDRDGVVNHEVGYLHKIDDARFMDGIFSLCRSAKAQGMKIIIVTNQAGIGRGYYTEAQFHELMDWMREELTREGAEFDAVYFSPHHPEHGIGEYKRESEDRKPLPGMLLRAAHDHGIDLASSIMIGDRCSDVAAANAAGLAKAFLISGTEAKICTGDYTRVETLAEVEAWLLQRI